MKKNRIRMGRPPAKWVYKILYFDVPDNYWIDKNEISDRVNISMISIKEFMKKLDLDRKIELVGSHYRAKFQYGNLKKAVSEYVSPWPLE